MFKLAFDFLKMLRQEHLIKNTFKKRPQLTVRNNLPSLNCVDWGKTATKNKTNDGFSRKNIEIVGI